MKIDTSDALFADHLQSYSDTFKLLLISILLWEQFHWFLVWTRVQEEKCLVHVLIWFCFTSVKQKEGQLICHLKRSDVKSLLSALSYFLKSHKGIFRHSNSFLNYFSQKKSIVGYLNYLSPSFPLSFSFSVNTRATSSTLDAGYVPTMQDTTTMKRNSQWCRYNLFAL